MTAVASPDVRALRAARRRRRRGQVRGVGVLGLRVAGLWAASLMVGETFYGPSEVWRVIIGQRVPGATFTVGTLRLPRATLAVLAGLAFGAAGATSTRPAPAGAPVAITSPGSSVIWRDT